MVHVNRTFTVQAKQDQAVAYLADFSHATEWDPGTESCERIGAGNVDVGAQWHNVSKIGPSTTELVYTLESLSADGVTLVGRNDTAEAKDVITVRQVDDQHCEIEYDATVTLKGAAKLADPFMKLIFLKLAKETVEDLTAALEKHANGGASA